ncbi:NAD-dependent epimerase/dehydratase family protein [Amycolatopsis orientalis]|uniref:NAD-dependent epimerase/dehydratase family protein n=1 Tax=Amycolatopsis orientalis TaxID=31958 RepID=UPI0003A4C266|nr:NAD(P)-dependent oxidoreductase [Amycolatopsis orientalis]
MTAGLGADGRTGEILVTGATGFIGSAVLRALLARGAPVRVLARGAVPGWITRSGVRIHRGDLTDAAGLAGACTGVTTLVHAASRIGGTEGECAEVNDRGTARLLAEAHRAGTRRVVYLSTCAVYRDGEHRGAPEDTLELGPASATSRTRLAGEQQVRAAGGIVLRPHLVYGDGDRHVVPALAKWLRTVPAWADGGRTRTSVVSSRDLAAVLSAFALDPALGRPGEVFHVADPEPVRMRELLEAVCTLLDLPVPASDVPLREHRARMPWLSEHQWSLLTKDHWYDSGKVWQVTGVPPGPGIGVRLAQSRNWYRECLAIPQAG